jgi:hypothetical protein
MKEKISKGIDGVCLISITSIIYETESISLLSGSLLITKFQNMKSNVKEAFLSI